jgi:hypothetical protein
MTSSFSSVGGVLGAAAFLLAQSRVLVLELLEALEQVRGRIFSFGVARRDALGHQLLELRVEVVNAGHVAGSGGERPNALPVAVPRGLRQALPHRVRRVVAA